MRHLFIINPAAGKKGKAQQLEEQIRALEVDWEIVYTGKEGDAERYARAAAETGEAVRIYACGGDGTLNEVVNGAAGFPNAAITHYPTGSGNDFVKIFDQPEAFRELERLLDSQEALLDLMECSAEGQVSYAANICSMGLDARIGTEIGRYRRLPLVSGKGAYLLSTAVNLCKGIHKPYVIELDNETIRGNQTLLCVCNGRWYGGSFNPCPDAEPDDGMLEVLVVKPVNLLQVAMVIGKYQKGQYADYPQLISHYRTRQVTVSCGEDSVVNLDGEALRSREVTFRISGEKLRFFYPRGLSYRMRERKAEEACAI